MLKNNLKQWKINKISEAPTKKRNSLGLRGIFIQMPAWRYRDVKQNGVPVHCTMYNDQSQNPSPLPRLAR